jgi:hypothetical protein
MLRSTTKVIKLELDSSNYKIRETKRLKTRFLKSSDKLILVRAFFIAPFLLLCFVRHITYLHIELILQWDR